MSLEGNTYSSFDIGTRPAVERPGSCRGAAAQSPRAYANAERLAKSCYAMPLHLSWDSDLGTNLRAREVFYDQRIHGQHACRLARLCMQAGLPRADSCPLLGKLSLRAAS